MGMGVSWGGMGEAARSYPWLFVVRGRHGQTRLPMPQRHTFSLLARESVGHGADGAGAQDAAVGVVGEDGYQTGPVVDDVEAVAPLLVLDGDELVVAVLDGEGRVGLLRGHEAGD